MKKSTRKSKNMNRTLFADEKAAEENNGEMVAKKTKIENDDKQNASDKTVGKRCFVSLRKRKLSTGNDEIGDGSQIKEVIGGENVKTTRRRRNSTSVTLTNAPSEEVTNLNANKKAKVCLKKMKPPDVKKQKFEEDGNCVRSNIGSILDVFLPSPERGDKRVKLKKSNILSLSLKKKGNASASSSEEDLSKPSNASPVEESSSSATSFDATGQGETSSESASSKSGRIKTALVKSVNNLASQSCTSRDAETKTTDLSDQNKDNITSTNKGDKNTYKPPGKLKRCSVRVQRTSIKPGQPMTHEKQTSSRNKRPNIFTSRQQDSTVATHQSPPPTCKSPDIFSDGEANDKLDIYAFQTQSSQSEREDVAADIIEKMKKEGKVKVMKAKPQPVRKATKKIAKKLVKQRKVIKNPSVTDPSITDDKTKQNKPATRSSKAIASVPAPYVDDDHSYDEESDFPQENNHDANISSTKSTHQTSSGFSALAQNVLRKETAKNTPLKPPKLLHQNRSMNREQLLQMAKKFVNDSNISHSTPNKPLPNAISESRRQNASSSGGTSPWRVNSNSVPQLFYFSRASDNLPSYSSDVLPSSQPINNSKNSPELNKTSAITSPSKPLDNSLNISALKSISPIKSNNSSKLNISNIENISPIRPFDGNAKENAVIIGANPRRGLVDRSPLKPINVLNVVTLPNRIRVQQTNEKPKITNENKTEKLTDNSKQTLNESHINNTLSNTIASDFFGFSDENDFDEANLIQPLPKTKLPNKTRLQKKLIKLKRLLPPKPTRFNCETIRSIFNSPKKQPDIREMLSSTRNKSMAEPVAATNVVNDSSDDEASSIAEEQNDMTIVDDDLHLFDDPADPQSSFNTSIKIRTYQRPKRKPKKVHSFVLFKSDTESDEEEPPMKNKRRKTDKNKKELGKFIDEFNSMCEEVDQYELVVEKKKTPIKQMVC